MSRVDRVGGSEAWPLLHLLLEMPPGLLPGHVLISGPPGVGKSYSCLTHGLENTRRVYYTCFTAATSRFELEGLWLAKNGTLRFLRGAAIDAWVRDGTRAILDEIDHSSTEGLDFLHPYCDDRSAARITLPNKKVVTPGEVTIFALTNRPREEALPPPLADRFSYYIIVSRPPPAAIDSLSPDVKVLAQNQDFESRDTERCLGFRALKAFDRGRSSFQQVPSLIAKYGEGNPDLFLAAERLAAALVFGADGRGQSVIDSLKIARSGLA